MAPTDRRPSTLVPRPPVSIAPILSIFTLRPKAVTVKPAAPPPRSRPRTALVALLAVTCLGLLGWHLAKPREPRPKQAVPLIVVNGAPKEKVTDQGKPERWANVPLKVKLDASLEQLGPGAVSAVQAGFGAWLESDVTLPSLGFDTTAGSEPRLEPDGVNAVMFVPIALPGHKGDLALTISFVDAATGRILESDIVINSKKPFGLLGSDPSASNQAHDDDGFDSQEVPGCAGAYDLQSVVTHEAGHFFGLGEDQEDATTTMFFKTGKCEVKKRDLALPDQSVMRRLYEQPDPGSAAADSGGGCGGASVARRPNVDAEMTLAFALALLGCVRRRKRA